MNKIETEILNKLNNYLEFNIDVINKKLPYTNDNFLVFGGSIRDIISGSEIKNDVDILVKPDAFRLFLDILSHTGWKQSEYIKKSSMDLYKDIQIIFEPYLFFKDGKSIQLIKPSLGNNLTKISYNVDISCCGVSFNGESLIENVEGAILDCVNKRFRIIKSNIMYNENRIHTRIEKHLSYGFKIYEPNNRRTNLDKLLHSTDITFDYAKAYRPEENEEETINIFSI